jgi:hypothetical protein
MWAALVSLMLASVIAKQDVLLPIDEAPTNADLLS